MKKILVATTAIVAFSAVSAQAADPIKLSLGGFMKQWVGYADNEEDGNTKNYEALLNQSNSEIYFTGSTKLDNGLSVGVVFQKEADRDATGYDEVYLSISSDALGTVKLGSTAGVAYKMAHASTDVGIGNNDGDVPLWIAKDASVSATANSAGNAQDGQGVYYTSPSFGGFQFGASYGLNRADYHNNAIVDTKQDGMDYRLDAVVAYNGDLGGVTVGADLGYNKVFVGGSELSAGGDDVTIVRGGVSIGVAGFTIGGGYLDVSNFAQEQDRDGNSWDLGVAYATGPYSVSLTYANAKVEESATDSREDEVQQWMVSGAYDLGAGVALKGSVFQADYDDASTSGANSAGDDSSFGVVAGVTVDF